MMMLHQKRIGCYEMLATFPKTGEQHQVNLDRVLAPNQRRALLWHPDMVLRQPTSLRMPAKSEEAFVLLSGSN